MTAPPLRVRIVARPEAALGFALSGVPTIQVASAADLLERWPELVLAPDAGILIIEAELYGELPEEIRRDSERRPRPLIVPCPGPGWIRTGHAPDEFIVELLRQAIGYRVRLK